LCYLLLNPQPHQRERLAAVFWGDHPVDASRKYLSQTLWRLRQLLQAVGAPSHEYLTITNETITFNQASPYWLDIEYFETVIKRYQGISGRHLTPDQADELETAVALYTEELLAGVYEDWLLYDRERLNLLYLDSLSKLMIFHQCHHAYERGLTYGERLLKFDNTREQAHRQIMHLYWLAGDRSAAMAQYKQCVQILRDELGIAPMLETSRLYQQIVHNQLRPSLNAN
jgi:DNA-binding SARP family transcriptional activator